MSIKFTPDGHAALARGQARTGLSRDDYLEQLARDEDRRQARRLRVAQSSSAGGAEKSSSRGTLSH